MARMTGGDWKGDTARGARRARFYDRLAKRLKNPTVIDRARSYNALQDERAKLVRQYEQLELEIADIDRQLRDLER